MKGYEFFFRSQPIFKLNQAGRLIYVVIEGQVAIVQAGRLVETLGPGQYLVEATLPPATGLIAIAHTDCRLVALNEAMLATLVQCSPEVVGRVGRMMAGLTRLEPTLRRPASLQVKRVSRPPHRPRQEAEIYPVVQAEGVRSKE
jgi:CRP-like cAMP-binding protein